LTNPNFRNQEFFVKNQKLIRRFFPQKSGEKSGTFFQRIRKSSGDIFQKFREISESFLNQSKEKSIRQFSLGETKLHC
jgi:hypothetical protein